MQWLTNGGILMFETRVPPSMAQLPGRVHVMQDDPLPDYQKGSYTCNACGGTFGFEQMAMHVGHDRMPKPRKQCRSCYNRKVREYDQIRRTKGKNNV